MIAFAFLYRFGYGLLDKMGPLFMIDSRANGGLGLTNQALGDVNGTSARRRSSSARCWAACSWRACGLKKTLLILCLCLNVPNATFLYPQPDDDRPTSRSSPRSSSSSSSAGAFGAVGHMIYMMQQIAPGPYKTAHYTFATALMGACMMITGAQRLIQNAVGYQWFFIIVLLAAAPVAAGDDPRALPPPRRIDQRRLTERSHLRKRRLILRSGGAQLESFELR